MGSVNPFKGFTENISLALLDNFLESNPFTNGIEKTSRGRVSTDCITAGRSRDWRSRGSGRQRPQRTSIGPFASGSRGAASP